MHEPQMSSRMGGRRLKIIEASISENGKKVFLLIEWTTGKNKFRTSRSLRAEDVYMIEVKK